MRTFRPQRFALAVFVLLSGLVAACTTPEQGGSAWTVSVDTLPDGARHVVNVPPTSGGVPQWTLQQELRIGSADGSGPAGFGQIKGLAVTSDGRIAVLETMAQELRVFSPTGEHLATFGGKGQGPGQLEGPVGVMRDAHDRLWVPDVGNARMSVFDATKGFEESFPMSFMTYGWVWRGVMAADGHIVKPSITMGPPRRSLLRVWNDSMRLVDTLPLPPPAPYDRKNLPGVFQWTSADGQTRGMMSVPFYPPGDMLLDPAGGVWSTEGGDPSYRISYWTPGGDTTLVLETHRRPVEVTKADRDSAIASVRQRLKKFGVGDQDWSKIPAVKPAVASMFLSDDGDLWVQTPSPDGRTLYDRYDRTGRYVGTVASELHVLSWVPPIVRGDLLWAVVTDSLDVPYVVRERIVAAGGG